MITLGIETSCDETAVAVLKDAKNILSSEIATQIDIHGRFGGVVPEIAARMHANVVNIVLDKALEQANIAADMIDLIAVTSGPGLMVSLVVGISCARILGSILDKPVFGVNHLEAHIMSNMLSDAMPEMPAICLLVSGGHTEIVLMRSIGEYEILGSTRDDAAGEAFDKVARLLNLPYPGGPAISDQALKASKDRKYELPRPMMHDPTMDFSFSGLKTAVVNELKRIESNKEAVSVPEMAAEFEQAVVDVLCRKTLRAAQEHSAKSVMLCGGVAANKALRAGLQSQAETLGVPFFCPPLSLCTDNAAMVACAGYHNFTRDLPKQPLSPQPNITL